MSPAAPAHRFAALDSLRGLAALGVLLHHMPASNGLATIPLASAGGLFVDLFFVISGFVIAESYGERLANGFSRARFAVLRLGRVLPLHLVMVAAFLALELAAWAFGSGGLNLRAPFTGVHSGEHLLRAVLLLDAYIPEKRNYYNGVSWSIAVELLLYALAATAFHAGRLGLTVFIALGLGALVLQLAGVDMLILTNAVQRGMAGFAAGMLCWLLYQRRAGQSLPAPGLLEPLALGLLLLFVWNAERFETAGLVVVPSALAAFVFAHQAGWLSRLMLLRWPLWLGTVSYSLYMVHVMVMARIADLFLLASRHLGLPLASYTWQGETPIKAIDLPLLPALAVQLAMILACAGVAGLTWRWIEEPARQWSRRLAERL
ncbi:acyltransferase [Novosphingobium sp.]|uniref:acyltransferase family protein n=1 Tax=Novosphingobium sp. TaxID=1874826 RepID=UPI0025D41740|nr:acyltransferase [Novosphingobium sp.]MCC6925019.1 acyltransferase [Novosphingobium sp.]